MRYCLIPLLLFCISAVSAQSRVKVGDSLKVTMPDGTKKRAVITGIIQNPAAAAKEEKEASLSLKGKKVAGQFKDLDGLPLSFSGYDKPVFLHFWFINCPPCIKEMPMLNELKNKYQSQMDFVSVTFEPEERVKEFLSRKSFGFRHITGQELWIKELGVFSYPTTLIV